MLTRAALTLTAVLASFVWASEGEADTYRMVDSDGAVHLTNAPTDPRYRGLPVVSGTVTGWLRMSETSHSQYATDIKEIASRHGVDPTLVESVIRAESAFNATAVSRTGARGLMQLMPETAVALGVRDSFNPRENIEGGVRHLRYLLDRYPGNVSLAVAAYNAGEAAVDQYRGIPPYAETQQYVQRVLQGGGRGGVWSGRSALPRSVYRYTAPNGTVTYSNLPPGSRLSVSR
ncbi:MAG TPA: lytic transglycosylase domain-containing protein [Methylomirabilota bacterium]|nr:lytic transglycosylase domain-containing protein [Methylomirabilota bacterium]